MSITYISDIKTAGYVNRIRVRASRVWRPKRSKGDAYDGLHYLLIDEKVMFCNIANHFSNFLITSFWSNIGFYIQYWFGQQQKKCNSANNNMKFPSSSKDRKAALIAY